MHSYPLKNPDGLERIVDIDLVRSRLERLNEVCSYRPLGIEGNFDEPLIIRQYVMR